MVILKVKTRKAKLKQVLYAASENTPKIGSDRPNLRPGKGAETLTGM
jgi:hypothetical protein